MEIREVMNKNVVVAKKDITLVEASEVMSKLNIGSLIIAEDNGIIGIVTSTDILKAIARGKKPDITLAEEIMSKQVVTIDPGKSVEDAVELMVKNKIKKLPVMDENKIMGMITASDIMVVEPKMIAAIASMCSIKSPYSGG